MKGFLRGSVWVVSAILIQVGYSDDLSLNQRMDRLENQVSYLNQSQNQWSGVSDQLTQLTAEVQQSQQSQRETERTVQAMQQTIATLKQQVSALQLKVGVLQTALSASEARGSEMSERDGALTAIHPQQSSVEKESLDRSSATSHRVNTASKEQPESSKVAASEKTDRVKTSTSMDDRKRSTSADQASQAQMEGAYQKAYGLLIEKKYSDSTRAFEDFVKRYPNSSRATDAWYWLGELYLTQGHPDQASQAFRKVVRVRSSAKRPDALLSLGTIYLANGDAAHAKESYDMLIDQYPKSQAASQARTRLKDLGRV